MRPCARATATLVTWAHDANYYQFWAEGGEDGQFTIANVRPGTYTASMRLPMATAFGEFAQADITVAEAGQNLNLGKIEWKARALWHTGLGHRLPRPHRRQISQR